MASRRGGGTETKSNKGRNWCFFSRQPKRVSCRQSVQCHLFVVCCLNLLLCLLCCVIFSVLFFKRVFFVLYREEGVGLGDGNFAFTGDSPYVPRGGGPAFQTLQFELAAPGNDNGLPPSDPDQPARKRRMGDDTGDGAVEAMTVEGEEGFAGTSAQVKAREELYKLTQLCKQNIQQVSSEKRNKRLSF